MGGNGRRRRRRRRRKLGVQPRCPHCCTFFPTAEELNDHMKAKCPRDKGRRAHNSATVRDVHHLWWSRSPRVPPGSAGHIDRCCYATLRVFSHSLSTYLYIINNNNNNPNEFTNSTFWSFRVIVTINRRSSSSHAICYEEPSVD